MSKKEEIAEEFVPKKEGSAYDPTEGVGSGIESDFDLDSEYKPNPLIPNGGYHGGITEVKLDTEQQCIVFTITLSDNGGVMTDGETSIDGVTVQQRVWLPKPGDENELTKNGKSTKRQSKINMMQDQAKKLGISLSKPIEIINMSHSVMDFSALYWLEA